LRRPLWPVSVPPPTTSSEFGLPSLSLLGEVLETAEARGERHTRVRRAAFRFYRRIVDILGEAEAKRLFWGFVTEPRRRGRKRRPVDPARDEEFLWRFFECQRHLSPDEMPKLPRALAAALGPRFGASPEAREKKLRRLLKAWERKQALQKARLQRLTGHLPRSRTLLQDAADGDTKPIIPTFTNRRGD
jgi:hypothetical protein